MFKAKRPKPVAVTVGASHSDQICKHERCDDEESAGLVVSNCRQIYFFCNLYDFGIITCRNRLDDEWEAEVICVWPVVPAGLSFLGNRGLRG